MNWRSMMTGLAVVLGACGDDDGSVDPDAREIDAPLPIDAPDGPCGADYQMTGEYVDWASTAAMFAGVNGATWTVVGDAARTATTAPNGRVIMCLSRGATVNIDVVQTATPYLPALFVADPAVLSPPGGIFSARGLKMSEAPQRWDELMSGMTFNVDQGHVLVVKRGTPTALTLGGQDSYVSDGVDDITWMPGDTGVFTVFPNVDPGPTGTGTASLGGAFTGPRTIPIQEGKLTIVPIAN